MQAHLNTALLAAMTAALAVIAIHTLNSPRLTADDIANAVALAQGKPCINPAIPPAPLEP